MRAKHYYKLLGVNKTHKSLFFIIVLDFTKPRKKLTDYYVMCQVIKEYCKGK